ncbi:L-rhamnonate dehydratase [Ferroplasma acidiphilum]|uniref:L-rhamnonate dehydratase n=1 Tax=Ferroplasma acidiphilum TaxID=74969 RepID=A0A7K4FNN4_9ARCH|nr:L-rhamnonate dehydratase [Ferroplasma acidiphilum]NOL59939.1 L-rhamnonate dehydratase [Ferroplasma acidiphilum]WMT52386.1 MAG: L-rhamnonate dehydratase [Ferroplasma acidiphilum]
MKVESIKIIGREKVKQPVYRYVKPTDYYKDILGEVSPTEAAMINEVCTLEMKAGQYTSYYNTTSDVASFVMEFSGKLKEFDISEINMAWDMLYRLSLPLGRSGVMMHALSAVNIMMYDIYSKSLNVPAYKIMGGATRKRIRAYASHLHPTDLKELRKEAEEYVSQGYKTMKMRFISGPSDINGLEKNIELVKTIRDAVGYDVELAGDAWMSWNYNFALKMVKKLERYDMAWVEEPLMPDDFDAMKMLSWKTGIPISEGEHHYHVYDFKRLLDAGIRILQPDAVWTGGITPMKKIIALAETYGAIVVPHTGNIYNLHVIGSEPESVTPVAEFLTKYREWMEQHMEGTLYPEKGYFTLSDKPGFGLEYKPQ